MISHKFLFTLQVCLFLTLTARCFGQTAAPENVPSLKLNVPIEGQIAEAGTETFALRLEINQIAKIELEQKNAQLQLIVDDAKTNERLVQINASYSSFGYERLLFQNQTAAPRDVLIRVDRFANDKGTGGFKLRLAELQTAEAKDQLRLAAQEEILNGLRLSSENKKESKQQSLVVYENALKLARQSGDSMLEATALFLLQNAYSTIGDYKKSVEYGTAALPLLAGPENSYDQTKVKYYLGYSLVNMGEPQQGVEVLSEVLTKMRGFGDRTVEGWTLNTLSYGYNRLNNMPQSIELAQQAYEVAKNNREKTSQSVALLNLSNGYDYQADFLQSIETLKKALPLAQEAGTLTVVTRIYNQLGSEYAALGQLQKSLDYHQLALPINRQLNNKIGEGISLANIAGDYSGLGQNSRALEYNRQALQIYNELGNKDSISRALYTTASIYLNLQDYGQAKETLLKALKLAEEQNSTWQKAALYHRLGFTESRLNNNQAAVEYFEKAAQSYRNLKSKRLEAGSLSAAAFMHTALGQFDQAAAAATAALELTRAVGDRMLESHALYNLAFAKRSRKDLVGALGDIEDSIKIIESVRSELTSQESRTSFFAVARYKYEFYIQLLIEMQNQPGNEKFGALAFAESERARARSLLDLLAESRIDVSAGISPELRAREQEIGAKLSALQSRLISLKTAEKQDSVRIKELAKDIDQADDEREQIESEIRRNNPKYAELKYPTTINLAQTQKLLDEKTVLLEYQIGTNGSFLFAVGKNELQIVPMPDEKSVRASVGALRRSISQPSRISFAEYLVKGNELYKTLIAPIGNLLKGKTKIIIAADGALNYLPFEVLLTGDTQAESFDKLPYLVRNFEISYTPSASVLTNLGEPEKAVTTKPAKSFLAFAAPDYDSKLIDPNQRVSQATRSAFGENRSWNLTNLKNAKTEADQIAAMFPAGQTTVFSGAEATEERAKSSELLSQYRYLHFAVHGLIDEQQPQFSSLVLSLPKTDDQVQTPNTQSASGPSPAAQAPKSVEDGLLQAPEIFNLRLRADLVTLSACETGLGQSLRGEGIIGLTRAFFYAGASSVMVSLWSVSDDSTASLMTEFYRQLRKNGERSKADALRQAQLKLIVDKRYAHPFYWAPFILQGKSTAN